MRIIVDIDDATGAVTITPETQDPEAVIANPEAVECVADGLTHEFRDAAGRMYRWHDAERQLNIYDGLGLRAIRGIDVNAVTPGQPITRAYGHHERTVSASVGGLIGLAFNEAFL